MNKIKGVFFDAGNTLLYINHKYIAKTVNKYGYSISEKQIFINDVKTRIYLNKIRLKTTEGVEAFYKYFNLILKFSKIKKKHIPLIIKDLINYNKKYHLWNVVPREVYKILDILKKEKYILAIISNSDGRIVQLCKKKNIYKYFDLIIDSAIVKVEKPNPEIFNIGLRKLNLKPDNVIYIGDLYKVDVVGARRANIKPLLFDPLKMYPENINCKKINSLIEILKYIK